MPNPISLESLLRASAPSRELIYARVGERALRAFVFEPEPGSGPGPRPAVAWIHGGAWVGNSAEMFFPHARYIAARNAVGISIEYRLIGSGASDVADCIADCAAAVRAIRLSAAELGIDPHRVAVAGDSAGGHLAACLATGTGVPGPHEASRPDVAVLFNPIVDLACDGWHCGVTGQPLEQARANPPAARVLDRARALSPLAHVTGALPPTLLLHGLSDAIVDPEQARRFAAAARACGAACVLELLPGLPHGFVVPNYKATPAEVADAFRRADRFLAAHNILAGPPTIAA